LCEPKYKTGFDRNLWIWEEYTAGSTYMISADVARGDGQDYSTFHVFKLEASEIVAEYKGKPTPDIFADILFQAGKEFGDCMLVVENNSVGWGVLSKLEERAYPNLYYSRKSTHEHVETYQAETTGVIPGFTTSSKTRPLVISKLEELIRNKLINIKSRRLYNEMKTFIWDNGKPQAMKKHNDDLIIACAIGCWVKETAFTINQRAVEYKKAFLTSMTSTSTELNTSIPGMLAYKKKEKNKNRQNYEDFVWLLKG